MTAQFRFLSLGLILLLGSCKSNECCNAPTAPIKVIIAASVEIKADKVDVFKNIAAGVVADSRAEAGCISYTLYNDAVTPNKFFFFEEWKDSTAIDFHFSTAHFKAFGAALDSLAVGGPSIKKFEVSAEK